MNLYIAIVTAIGTVGAAGLMAWGTSGAQVASVQAQIQVVEERENNHYLEVKEGLDRIENKLDALIDK